MIRHRVRILFAISVIVLVALACELERNSQTEEAEEVDQGEFNPILDCPGNIYLAVQAVITKNEVTQFGTSCWYKLTITNTSPTYYIWPVVYNWHEDGYQNIKEGRWQQMIRLGPGKSIEWTGNYTTYKDTDAKGPNVNEVQKIVGIYDDPDCVGLISKNEILDKLVFFTAKRPLLAWQVKPSSLAILLKRSGITPEYYSFEWSVNRRNQEEMAVTWQMCCNIGRG